MNSPILVSGAAGGEQGSTGRHIVRLLRKRGLPVRALVHRLDQRCDELQKWGAEVVAGDFLDFASIKSAMAGVERAYFAYPVVDGLLEATAIFAEAARSTGVKCVVEIGHLNNAEDAASPRTREQWLSERVFDWANIGAVHLRCAVFYSNLRAFGAASIPGKGLLGLLSRVTGVSRLFLPSGEGTAPIPFVAGADVARVAAAILAEPSSHLGQTYLVSGPRLCLREVAEIFSKALGRKVKYQQISRARFQSVLSKMMPKNPHVVEHLTVLWSEVLADRNRENLARLAEPMGGVAHLSDVVKTIGGQKPITLENDIRHHFSRA